MEVNAAGELLRSARKDQATTAGALWEVGGERRDVEDRYVVRGDGQVGFAVGDYDAGFRWSSIQC